MNDDFNWDIYMATAPYDVVLRGMRVARKIIPTMFSPNRDLIYLATYDLAFSTSSISALRPRLDEIYNSLREEWNRPEFSIEQIYRLEVDYKIVWDCLYSLGEFRDESEDPNENLKKIYQSKIES